MTVAAAVKYPWGVLEELVPQGIVIPEAIILISDSRFRLNLKPSESPQYLLIGACNKQRMAELYRFSYSEDFRPEWIEGYVILRWPETRVRFGDLVSSKLK